PERQVGVPGERGEVEPGRQPECPDGQRLAVARRGRRDFTVRRHGVKLWDGGGERNTSPTRERGPGFAASRRPIRGPLMAREETKIDLHDLSVEIQGWEDGIPGALEALFYNLP